MPSSILPTDDLELHEAFGINLSIKTFKPWITDIAELIYRNNLTRESLHTCLKEHGIKKVEDIKEDFLDLLIVYINLVLNDHIISENEHRNIQLLKMLFKIKEGDFHKYRNNEIEDVLHRQFERIYRNDDRITPEEAMHKVGLQELFDLSYDQLLKFKELEVRAAIERGADISKLDTVVKHYTLSKMQADAAGRSISQQVKDQVWRRDEGKCVLCGSQKLLEFDHIIPYSKGGSNTYRNVQLLCQGCNRSKFRNL